MKKRRYLKKWVEVVLIIILMISLIILGSETEKYFILSKLTSIILFVSSVYILLKYGRLED